MATEQKAEKVRTKKGGTTPATAKSNGKRKINNNDAPAKVPIARSPSSKSHNHQSNGVKSTLKSSKEEQLKVSGEAVAVDDSVPVSPTSNGIDVSKKKKKIEKTKKEKKEDTNKKKMNNVTDEKESGLLYQIPMNRVSRIIKSEDPNVRITQDAVYIINKASEKFLQVLATEAYASAFLDRKKHIDYKHLSSVVSKRKRFDFLSDFVPEKLKAEDALKETQTIV